MRDHISQLYNTIDHIVFLYNSINGKIIIIIIAKLIKRRFAFITVRVLVYSLSLKNVFNIEVL